eukprot:534787_1
MYPSVLSILLATLLAYTVNTLTCHSNSDCTGNQVCCIDNHCKIDCTKYQMDFQGNVFAAKMAKAEAIADYYYDAEVEQAREERAERLLKAERNQIRHAK